MICLPAPPKWDLLPLLPKHLDGLNSEPLSYLHGAFGIMMMMIMAKSQDTGTLRHAMGFLTPPFRD